jgi:hypothetical protein
MLNNNTIESFYIIKKTTTSLAKKNYMSDIDLD